MNHLFFKTLCGVLPILLLANAQSETLPENDIVEFDGNLLMPINGQTVDVSRFRYGNPINAGDYDSEIFVNGEKRGQFKLTFTDIPQKPISGLCFTSDLFKILDAKKDALAFELGKDACHDITQAMPNAKTRFDATSQKLFVDLPDNLLVKRPKGYIPPSQWQRGVPAAYVKYNFNQYQTSQNIGENQRYAYLGVQAGANLGAWTLRHSGSYSWRKNGDNNRYRSNETYVQRDIDAFNSRLIVGDFYTRSNVNENFGVRGVSLLSDTRMLPYSVTGYAPIVRGVANTNARVTVRQNGNIIHETNVAAGAFEINDLSPNGYSSDLHVEILEADGSRREFIVPTAISSQMLRPKHWRYEATIGRYRNGTKVSKNNIAQASLQYGLNNSITLKTGATLTKNYAAAVVGGVYSNRYGSWETDFQAARLKKYGTKQNSNSISIAYNKNFSQTGTYLYAKWQKYLSNRSFGLSDAVRDDGVLPFHQAAYKHRAQISLNQKLGEKAGNIYVSGSSTRHYGTSKSSHEYQIGYSNSYKRLNYSFGFSQSRDVDTRKKHNQFYANLFVPLGGEKNWLNHHWLDTGYQKDSDSSRTRVALNGSWGKDSQFSYGVSASRETGSKQNSYSGSLGYRMSGVGLSVNTSRYNKNTQWGFGATGAIVAHPRGVTLSRELGETFAVVHAKHAKGAKIRSATSAKLDYFGNGIVPNLSPYRVNHVGINPENLPDDVEVAATGKDIVPRAHSINLVEFATTAGALQTFQITLADGQTMPPMAAEVFDEKGKSVGYVLQDGKLMTRGLADSGSLKINWDDKDQCQFDYRIHNKNNAFNTVHLVSCKPIE